MRAPVLLLVVAVAVVPGRAPAQDTAIEGRVVAAADGRPVPYAVVLLAGTALETRTDPSGRYRFGGLAAGMYGLRVLVPGFRPAEQDGVRVAPGTTTTVDFRLVAVAVELPGVVVTASRSTGRVGEVPASVAIVSGAEVRARNSITLEDALLFAAGVTFNGGQMDIRGATGAALGIGSRVLMLVDGHRVLDGATGEIDFDALPLLDVERVEIVKGAHSALYGSNALGGVVNVITRRAPERPRTVLRVHGGAWDHPERFTFTDDVLTLRGVDALHQRRVGAVGTSLFVGRKTADGFKENGDYDRWLLRGKVEGPAGDAPWDAFASFAREDHGEFVAWRDAAAPFEVPPPQRGDWLRSDKFTAGATLVPLVRAGAALRFRPQVHYTRVQNYFASDSNRHRATRLGTEAQLSLSPHPRHAVTVGADGFYTVVRSTFIGNTELTDAAAYVQDEIALGARWTMSAGARLDHHRAEGGGAAWTLNPKLGVVHRVTPDVALRASVSRGYRAPSAAEQFVSTTFAGFQVVPNPELGGETAVAGEVGVTATWRDRVRIDAGLFHSEYDDLIEPAVTSVRQPVIQFRNVADARVSGIDVGGELAVRDGVSVGIAYLLLATKDLRLDEPLPYRSRHTVSGTVRVGPVALDVRHRSRVERVVVFPLDSRGAITVVDLRGEMSLAPVGLQAKVANLFNAFYADVQERRPAPPRTILLSVTGTF